MCVSATWSRLLSLYLVSSSTQCLVMGVCFCLQQVLDEGSVMVDNLVDDLTIRAFPWLLELLVGVGLVVL